MMSLWITLAGYCLYTWIQVNWNIKRIFWDIGIIIYRFCNILFYPIPVLKHFSAYIVYVYRLINVRDLSMLFFWFKLLQFPFTNARTRRLHNVCVYRTFTFHSPLVCRSRIVPGFFYFSYTVLQIKKIDLCVFTSCYSNFLFIFAQSRNFRLKPGFIIL